MGTEAIAPLGAYPTLRRRGAWVFVSGMSARQADGSCAGVRRLPGGELQIDVAEQTRVVIAKIRAALQSDAETGPARTTVAVHQLPHPQMRIEITATACLGAAA